MLNQNQIRLLSKYFTNQPQIVAVYLYGSHARGTANPLSDIDIAVVLSGNYEDTEKLHLDFIGKIGEILKTDNVDVQLLTANTPPALGLSMIKGIPIYIKSSSQKTSIEAQILSRYQDFVPFLNLQISEMEKRIKEGTYAS